MKREMNASDAVREGKDAFARRAWSEAYTRLSAADSTSPLGIADLELLAASAYLIGKDDHSDDLWVRAHNEYSRMHDLPRAARCAFWLVLDLFTRGEIARAGGWLARAQRLLDDGEQVCAERGLLLVLAARLHIGQGDIDAAEAEAREAVEIARRFHDADLEVFARLIHGQVLVRKGDAAKAAAQFDEAMVAVTVNDVSPISVGVVYCAVIDACHQLFDIQRAREWTEALSRWCGEQPDLVPFRGVCLVHRAEIMRFSGAWSRAMEEAEHARDWLSRMAEQLDPNAAQRELPSFKYPIGAAFYELGELHRVRGDLANADAAYRQASRYGHSPEPGLALLRMAQGKLKVAEAAIRRVLAQPQSRLVRSRTLTACVDIMIAAGDLPTARAAAEELTSIAAEVTAPFLRASAAHALGAVLLAEGDARAALATLREAWTTWQELEALYDAARVRMLLALACRALDDDDAAELELDAARRVFERLAAVPDVARVNDLVRTRTRSDARALTPRELQVIGLVATGRTNRAIARHLSISERTVDRHVSNILTKLELSSRSAATAYAYEHGLL